MDVVQAKQTLDRLKILRDQLGTDWERTVLDTGLALIRAEGPSCVQEVIRLLADLTGNEHERCTRQQWDGSIDALESKVVNTLSLREASDFLAVLEVKEADRLDRTRALLQQVLAVARVVADELLKIILRGVSP